MGSDDLFKKRREDRKKRRYEFKTPRANSFLIVTEGERTEPLYFKGIQKLIKDKGYKIAWSNQSFEYWLYLHFYYSDSALHRYDWNEKLDGIFKQYHLGDGGYQKNYEDIYYLVDSFDGVNTAIKNAKRRMAAFKRGIDKPSEYNPGTTVHELVQDLKVYLEE